MGRRTALLLLVAVFAASLLAAVVLVNATFAGSHVVTRNRTSVTYGAAEFCAKCHPAIAETVRASNPHSASGGCGPCHGYSPNATNSSRNINVKHNITRDIYCTNCHADYNETTGDILLRTGPDVSGINQSAHYITNNTTQLYSHARAHFNQT